MTLAKKRILRAEQQAWRCYYCEQPMWSDGPLAFARQYRISARQAQHFQCTAEHLKAREDGGTNRLENIVAACRFCNSTRHRAKVPKAPEAYRDHVQNRIAAGRWLRLPKKRGRTNWPGLR